MATKKQSLDVKDFTEPVKEFSKLLKDTYLSALDFSLSVTEENKKVLNEQVEYLYGVEKDYSKYVKGFYDNVELPFGKVATEPFEQGIERVVNFQKSVLDSVNGVSDNVVADAHVVAKKNVEKAFSLFDGALDLAKS